MKVRIPVLTTLALDPAVSTSERADFNGITVVGCDYETNWYVMEATPFKGRPDEVIERVVRLCREYKPHTLSLEAVAAQILFRPLLVPKLREANLRPYIHEYHPSTKRTKAQRIESLQPLFKQGKIFIREGLSELLDQLDHFPELDHDDLLDSLTQHLEVVRPPSSGDYINLTRDWFEDFADYELEGLEKPVTNDRRRTDGTATGRSGTPTRRTGVRSVL